MTSPKRDTCITPSKIQRPSKKVGAIGQGESLSFEHGMTPDWLRPPVQGPDETASVNTIMDGEEPTSLGSYWQLVVAR